MEEQQEVTVSAAELDRKIQSHLEDRATQWSAPISRFHILSTSSIRYQAQTFSDTFQTDFQTADRDFQTPTFRHISDRLSDSRDFQTHFRQTFRQ